MGLLSRSLCICVGGVLCYVRVYRSGLKALTLRYTLHHSMVCVRYTLHLSLYSERAKRVSSLRAHPAYILSDKSSFFLLPLFSFFLARSEGAFMRAPTAHLNLIQPFGPPGKIHGQEKNTPYGGIFGISFRKNTPYSSIWGSISHNYSPDETINPRNMPIYGHIWQIYCRKQVFLSMYARQK